MVDLPSLNLSFRTIDPGTSAAGTGVDLDTGAAGRSVEVAVATPVGVVALHLGLDRLLHSTSPIDRLLHSPDPLARFRAGDVPSDPSPQMTRGMNARVGDIHAEIATRYAIAGVRPSEAALPATRPGADDLLTARVAVGADTRGVGAVRDPAEAAALPQRIGGPGGATAGERGISVNAALGAAPAAAGSAAAGTAVNVSLDGLVNILDRAGAPVVSARDAPAGAVLLYARADGATVAELRTASGFAGAASGSATPLTGSATGRAGDGLTLIGVFVPGTSAVSVGTATVARPAGPAAMESGHPGPGVAATAPGVAPAGGPVVAPGMTDRGAASVAPLPVDPGRTAASPAGGGATAAGAVRADAGTATGATTATVPGAAVPPPDGSTIPAGHPAAPGEHRPGFGEASDNADATDRPYIHAIWYDILALRFEAAGVSLLERSTALRDVVWATAMEHGPFAAADGGDVLSRVAASLDLASADDAAIIAALFAERARIDDAGGLAHYPEVLPFDQARVSARLADEAELAARRVVTG